MLVFYCLGERDILDNFRKFHTNWNTEQNRKALLVVEVCLWASKDRLLLWGARHPGTDDNRRRESQKNSGELAECGKTIPSGQILDACALGLPVITQQESFSPNAIN